jgi:hypothetical protein
MGGRSFMLAARIPMSRDGFDEWLRTPLPLLDIIENPSTMYSGWASHGVDPDWDLTAFADYPAALAEIRADRGKTPLQLLAARAAQKFTLVRHHGHALEVYLYDYHSAAYSTQTELLMLAGAGRFAHGDTEAPVMYWGGDVHPGLPMGGPPLAVMMVSTARSWFVANYPIDTLIADLRSVETDFLAAAVDQGDENVGWDSSEVLDPAVRAHVLAAPAEHS